MKNYKIAGLLIVELLLLFFTGWAMHQERKHKDYMNIRSALLSDTSTKKLVQKKILGNGMTILVKEVHTIPKVSLQIWYNVGSKDEKNGEKGNLIDYIPK